MKKRLLSLLLVLVMLLGVLPISVSAVNRTYTITVDLTEYTGNVISATLEDDYGFTSENCIASAVPGQSKTITYTYDRAQAMNSAYIAFILKLDAPVQSWVIDGKTYTGNYESADPVTDDWGYDSWDVSDADGHASCYKWLTDDCVTYTIKAISPRYAHDYEPTLVFDETMGTATSTLSGDNTYKLTATPKTGYLFAYWQKEGSTEKVTTKEHTVTLAQNETWNAVFRKPYQATVEVAEGCEGMGTVSASYSNGDTWRLSATPKKGYGFTGWDGGELPKLANNVAELTEDTTFTASFVRAEVQEITGWKIYAAGEAANEDDTVSTQSAAIAVRSAAVRSAAVQDAVSGGVPLKAGTSVVIRPTYTLNCSLPDSRNAPHGQILVYEGEVNADNERDAKLLAKSTDFFHPSGLQGYGWVRINDLPMLDKITLVLFTDLAEPYHKVYRTIPLSVEKTADSKPLGLTYLTSPDEPLQGSASYALERGPRMLGAAGYVDEDGQISLFLAGHGGVYYLAYGEETDLIHMAGQDDLNEKGDNEATMSSALAVGGPSADKLTALVRIANTSASGDVKPTRYELRTFKNGRWTTLEGSDMTTDASLFGDMNGTRIVVVDSDDVWAGQYHWNGSKWETADITIDSAVRLDNNHVYAATRDALYRYENESGEWKQLTTDTAGYTLRGGNRSGQLILTKKRNPYGGNYPIDVKLVTGANTDSVTVRDLPTVTTNLLGSMYTNEGVKDNIEVNQSAAGFQLQGAGVMPDGSVYLMISRQYVNYLGGSYLFTLNNDTWTLANVPDFSDPRDEVGVKYRPNGVTMILDLADNVTLFTGLSGSNYLYKAQQTVRFDSMGGSAVEAYTGDVWSVVPLSAPTKQGAKFLGWYLNADCTEAWNEPMVRAKELTVYAKWSDSAEDKYKEDRDKALAQLKLALERMDRNDYTAENWAKVEQEYENGRQMIAIADPQPVNSSVSAINKAVQDTIYAALNKAVDRMNAVPMAHIKDIQVVVSMDAQTLGLGYFIKPTLITTKQSTQASKIITDEIVKGVKAVHGLTLPGHQAYHAGEPSGDYAYIHTGTVEDSFYLAEVYWPNQRRATVADYILDACGEISQSDIEKDRRGKYLGEFDYYGMSGWMYSISNINDKVLPSFPGVGAAGWRMRDGEVMRWQFTVYGYGADLNADNSAWGQASITGDSGDKTQLTYDIAHLREEYKKTNAGTANDPYAGADAKLGTSGVYTSVFENVLCDPLATQAELDQAVADLELVATELAERETFRNLASAIRSMGANEAKIAAAEETFNGFSDAYKRIFELAYPEEFTLLQGVNETAFRPITAVSAEPDTVYGTVNGTMITLGGYRSANETVSLKDQNGSDLTIADGKITIRNVTYTVVDTAVEILPAEVKLSEGAADVKAPEGAKQEVKNVAEAIGSSVTNGETKSEGLASAAASTVVEEAKKKAEESAPAGTKVEVHAETSLNIEVKDYQQDETTKQHVLTLKIEPQVTYTVKEKGTDTVVVPATKPQTIPNSAIKAPVTISVKLPDGMSTDNLYIKHYFSDRPGQYEYIKPEITSASPSGNIATWQQSSFSTIELLSDARSAIVSFNREEVTLTPADKDQPLPKASKEDKIFTGWIFTIEGEDGKATEIPGGPFMTLTEDLLTALSEAAPEDITATPNFKDKPKDPEPVTPVTPATPSTPAQNPFNPDAGKDSLPFADVNANSWYYSGVKYAYKNGLMNGTGTGTFSPNADTTRGMIVTMLARLEGQNTSGTPWYAAGQKWAMDAGISDGTNMTGAITREQLAAILFRYAKQKGYDVSKSVELNGFSDAAQVSGYATDAMRWAVASGLIQGSNSKLNPKGTATRAQVATILMRFMELYAK